MKKAMVTIVVGEKYRRIYNHVAPLNRKWMDRWGWDPIIIESIPENFRAQYAEKDKPSGWVFFMYKLYIPSLFRNYDLVAFIDSDCVINPNAECLSQYIDNIPTGGFAGGQPVTFEERKLFPNWNQYYYDDLRSHGYDEFPKYPDKHINSGLLLYRPSDVWERWLELLNMDSELNEENRLSVYEVQEDRCFFLPRQWHVVWLYERVRRGWSKGYYSNKLTRKLNQCLLKFTERNRINMVYREVSLLHFALEHHKTFLIDTTAMLSHNR